MEKQTSRMSILKGKSLNQSTSNETMPPDIKDGRRVSFASSNFVKPFSSDAEKNTIWDNTYEEEVNHTDSTKSSEEQGFIDEQIQSVSNLTCIGQISDTELENMEETCVALKSKIHISNSTEEQEKQVLDESMQFTCTYKNALIIENNAMYQQISTFKQNIMFETQITSIAPTVDLKTKEGIKTIDEFVISPTQTNQDIGTSMEFTCNYPSQSIISQKNLIDKEISVNKKVSVSNMVPDITQMDIKEMQMTCIAPFEECTVLPKENVILEHTTCNMDLTCNLMGNGIKNNLDLVQGSTNICYPENEIKKNIEVQDMELTCNSTNIRYPLNEIKKNIEVQDMELTCNSTNICYPVNEIKKNIEVQDMELTCNSTKMFCSKNKQKQDLETTIQVCKENVITNMDFTCLNKQTNLQNIKTNVLVSESYPLESISQEIKVTELKGAFSNTLSLDNSLNFIDVMRANSFDSNNSKESSFKIDSDKMDVSKKNWSIVSEVQKKCKIDKSVHTFLEDLTEQMVPYSCTNSTKVLNHDTSIIIPQEIPMHDFNTGTKQVEVNDEHITESETSNKNVKKETKTKGQQRKSDVSQNKIEQTYIIQNQLTDATLAGSSNDVSSQAQFETFTKSENNKCLKLPEDLGFTNTPGASFALFLSDDTEEEQAAKRIYTTNSKQTKKSSKEYENLQKNEYLVPLHKENNKISHAKSTGSQNFSKSFHEAEINLFDSTPLEDITTPLELEEISIKSDLEETDFKENQVYSNLPANLQHKNAEENEKDSILYDFQKYRRILDKCNAKFCKRGISDDLVRRCMEVDEEIKQLGKLKMPKIELLRLEDLFKADDEASSSRLSSNEASSTAESILEEDIEVSKSLEDKIQEAAKRPGKYWEFVRRENDCYLFYTLCQAVPFKVYVDPSFGTVQDIETFTNLLDNHLATTLYETRYMQEKLKKENLIRALGNQFDLLTLLDYVYMCMEDIVKFDEEYDELEADYLKSLSFRMNHDLSFTIEPCKINWLLWWIITVDLSIQNLGWKNSNEGIKAHYKADEPVPLERIKEIIRSIEGPHFIRKFIKKINDLVNEEGIKIMSREPENKYRGIFFKR